jgi:hypothetical protein
MATLGIPPAGPSARDQRTVHTPLQSRTANNPHLKSSAAEDDASAGAAEMGDSDKGLDDTDEEEQYRDPPEGCVRLRPSNFNLLPSTVFVEYPPELNGMKRNDVSVVEKLNKRQLCYESYWERICIRNAFKRAGFEKNGKCWTALWSKHQNSKQMQELNCLQKINHFPASWYGPDCELQLQSNVTVLWLTF